MSLPASLTNAFARVAERTPDAVFVEFEGTTVTYREMSDRSTRGAGALVGWGVRPGDRVALFMENSPRFIEAYLAVLWTGAVAVPINTRYRVAELAHIVADADVRLVLVDEEGSANHDVSVAAARLGVPVVPLQGEGEGVDAWRNAFGAHDAIIDVVPRSHGDLAVIVYTSGTTGRSRGAMLSHGNFLTNARAVTGAWGWTARDRLLLTLPLFHMHGLGVGLHGTIYQGSSMTLCRAFEEQAVFDELLAGRTTMFFGVPTMFGRLLQEARRREETPPPIRLLVSGSAPLGPDLLENVERVLGSRILERYGMTESVMNLGNPLKGERRPGSVGLPFDGVAVRIADSTTDELVVRGRTGEIQLRGPNVFAGYWRDDEATSAAFARDGWFKTGDLGYVDEDGYHHIVGRAKELIISGGFNVYPREVEEVLERHASVLEAAVLGVLDADLGERVVAVVVPRDAEASADVLIEHCRARIAGFKKPRHVHFVASLPRNALGKVQKHVLREQLAAERPPIDSQDPLE
ncbi:acyl-CoA synthetase [soil metagenome]